MKPLSEHLNEEDARKLLDEWSHLPDLDVSSRLLDLIAYAYERGHQDGKTEEREGL